MKVVVPVPLDESNVVFTNVEMDPYPEWDIEVVYRRGRRVVVTDPGINKVYESLYPNFGLYPPDQMGEFQPAWAEVGPTNPWAMFKPIPDLQTKQDNVIIVHIAPNAPFTAIAFFGLQATQLAVQINDALDTIVFYKVVDLTGPDVLFGESVVIELPSHPDGIVQVIIHHPGHKAVCETLVLGESRTLGTTRYELVASIDDHSDKDTNEFGITTLVEKGYAKKMSATVNVPYHHIDYVHKQLSDIRSTPCAWFATERMRVTIIYGFYKDFEIIVHNHEYAHCNIEIEALYYEVVPQEPAPIGEPYYLTSLTYPLMVVDGLQAQSHVLNSLLWQIDIDKLIGTPRVTGGELRTLLKYYGEWPPENVYPHSAKVTGGELRQLLKLYEWPPENVYPHSAKVTGGVLKAELIQYLDWPEERVQAVGGRVTGGTLV